MGLPRFACVAIAAFSLLPGFIMTGFADSPQDKSITLAEQGSFFVGGRIVQGKGVYDPAKDTGNTNEGNTFWTDQMYVQYQIPVNPRKYPLVLVHGGGGTGRVWETTPDGREGYQTIFLRSGFAVYIVDFPRRGRAGFPSFNGPFGEVRRAQQVTSHLFVQALNSKGGNASVLVLPDVGLYGNSHFMFSDLNNVEVADQLSLFLSAKGLDLR